MAQADEQKPPKRDTSNRKLIAGGILVAGLALAVVVSKIQQSRSIDATPIAIEPQVTSLGDSEEIPDELEPSQPESTQAESTQPDLSQSPRPDGPKKTPPATVATKASLPERAGQAVEPLPPAPGAKAGGAAKRQLPPRGPPTVETNKAAPPSSTSKTAPKNSAKIADPKSVRTVPLVEIGQNTYRSPAGLVYGPGSEEGHRLKHILRHAKDDEQRPIHGVFDGNRDDVLGVIDEAWVRAKKGGKGVSAKREGNRTVYLVDLNKRIGYVGGKTGKRLKNPATNHLRLVVEGSNVITAFPDTP